MPRSRWTVSPAGADGWKVSGPGGSSSSYVTKQEAVRAGRQGARAQPPSQLVIKGRNGRIQEERTYGDDPRRSKG